MDDLLHSLRKDFPSLKFKSGQEFCWSYQKQTISYIAQNSNKQSASWALLHELSHALLGHQKYESDLELVTLESEAWAKAKKLATRYGISIDTDHIEDCMDSYRDWLHQRSSCPQCGTHSLQHESESYFCYNCNQTWRVTSSRFCRPYRKKHQSVETSNPTSIQNFSLFV